MEAFARARMLAVDALAGSLVHEFANLLTVIDGVRQLRELGTTVDDAHFKLIDKPAVHCQEMVEAFRAFLSVPNATAFGSFLGVHQIAPLLRLRLRGRRATVIAPTVPAPPWLEDEDGARARLALLCFGLGYLEHGRQNERFPDRIEIVADSALTLRLTPFEEAAPGHPAARAAEALQAAARDLLAQTPYRLQERREPPAVELVLRPS